MKKWVAILAVCKNGVIGKGNDLPWNIVEEKGMFRTLTSGKTILIGRKTFESLKVLDETSKYLILTRNQEYKVKAANCEVIHDVGIIDKLYCNDELWICGGKEIYTIFFEKCEEFIVSLIKQDYIGDVCLDVPFGELIHIEIIQENEKFTTSRYINRNLYPCSRFTDNDELEKAYYRYSDGATNGVVGHHVNYPLVIENSSSINKYIEAIKSTNSDVINLYIHWPYCCLPNQVEKCDFCMCNTKNSQRDIMLKEEYFNCLLKEIQMYAHVVGNKKVGNVYIGGGTPLTMTSEMLERIFTTITTFFKRSDNSLFSIESRPELLNNEKIQILKKFGINKVSIGVESFNNELAFEMGRIKLGEDYFEIVESGLGKIRDIGIEYINIDLIYGHPDEDEGCIDESLNKVLKLKPDTISFYCMGLPAGCTNIEKNEKYLKKWKSIEYRNRQYTKIRDMLEMAGYRQIVESIWSKVDETPKSVYEFENGLNNTCFTCSGTWIGIGVGSFGFVENFGQIVNVNDVEQYIRAVNELRFPVKVVQVLSLEEQIRCEIIIGLLHGRINKKEFRKKYHIAPEQLFPNEFFLLNKKGDVKIDEREIILTSNSVNKMEGLCRLFFSKANELAYRERENKRVDYNFYQVSYSDLE